MIVAEGRPYGHSGVHSTRDWQRIPPEMVPLAVLRTTQRHVHLDALLAASDPYSGDWAAHVVAWRGALYLEDGHTRAARAALLGETYLWARVARP